MFHFLHPWPSLLRSLCSGPPAAEPSVLHHQNLLFSVRLHGCLPGLNQENDSTFTGESPTAHTFTVAVPSRTHSHQPPRRLTQNPPPLTQSTLLPTRLHPQPGMHCLALLLRENPLSLEGSGGPPPRGKPPITHLPPPSFSSKARSPPLRSHHLGQEPKKIQISAWLAECLGKALNYFSSRVRTDLEDGREDNHAARAEDGTPAPTAHHKAPLHCTWVVSLGFPTTGTCARRFCHSPLTRQIPQAGTHRTQSFLKEAVIGVRCTRGHFPLQR